MAWVPGWPRTEGLSSPGFVALLLTLALYIVGDLIAYGAYGDCSDDMDDDEWDWQVANPAPMEIHEYLAAYFPGSDTAKEAIAQKQAAHNDSIRS